MSTFSRFFLTVFCFTTFSGALRRWGDEMLFPSRFVMLIQLLLPLTAIRLIVNNHGNRLPTYLQALTVYFALLLLAACNPLNKSPAHALAGIAVHSTFWIMIAAYLSCRTRALPVNTPYLFLLFSLIEAVTGAVQYHTPPDRLTSLNNEEQVIAMMGDAVRSTGTFSHVAGYGAFGIFTAFLTCSFLKKHTLQPFPVILSAGLGMYICLLSGSRAAFISFFTITGLFLVFEPVGTHWLRLARYPALLILLYGLNQLANDPLKMDARFFGPVANFAARYTGGQEEFTRRLGADLTELVDGHFPLSMTGTGLGSTYQGINGLYGASPILKTVPFEGELFRLIIEGGYLLLVSRFLMLAILLAQFRFSAAFKSGVYILFGLFSSLVFNPYSAVFLAAGLILLDGTSEP